VDGGWILNGSLVWKDGNITLYRLKDDLEPSLDEFQLGQKRSKNIIEDMVSSIKEGTQVAVDGIEGRKSVAILDGIYESSETGKTVKLR